MILPDTNILIAYFSPNSKIRGLIDSYLINKNILFSVMVVAEFQVGAKSDEELQMANRMIESNVLIPVDKAIMKQAVIYRKEALHKSKRVLLLDCFIAATAKVHEVTLLTFDRRDYPFSGVKVKEPKELRVSSL